MEELLLKYARTEFKSTLLLWRNSYRQYSRSQPCHLANEEPCSGISKQKWLLSQTGLMQQLKTRGGLFRLIVEGLERGLQFWRLGLFSYEGLTSQNNYTDPIFR